MCGLVGSVFGEGIRFYSRRDRLDRELSKRSRNRWFWTITLVMVFTGPALVFMYELEAGRMLAFHIGLTSPYVIASMVGCVPHVSPGQVEKNPPII